MSIATHCTLPKDNHQSRLSMLYGEATASERSCFIDAAGLGGLDYLKDHRVGGKVMFPAAGFCMAGISALRKMRSTCKPMMLEKLKFRRSLSDHDSVLLRLQFKPGSSEFTVHSDHDNDHSEVTPHASGIYTDINTSVIGKDSKFRNLNKGCSEKIDVSDFYQRLHQSGLNYGPYFKRISEAHVSRSSAEAVTRISCHPQLMAAGNQQAVQITLLDSAFQSLAAALKPDQFGLYVPSRIRTLRIFDDLAPNLWCNARTTKTTSRAVVGDITIFGADQRPLMDIRGLSCLKLPQSNTTCSNTATDNQGVLPYHNESLQLQSPSNEIRN